MRSSTREVSEGLDVEFVGGFPDEHFRYSDESNLPLPFIDIEISDRDGWLASLRLKI